MLHVKALNDSTEGEERKCYLIESLQITNWWRYLHIVWKFVLKMCNQHAKLSSPVSNVVDTENKPNKISYGPSFSPIDLWPTRKVHVS